MNKIKDAIKFIGTEIINQKDFLTELDQAIGDGDHGINMARGFNTVFKKLDTIDDNSDASVILKTVGMGLLSSVGGASGPLYGTAFLRASMLLKNQYSIDLPLAIELINAAIKGIQDRGKAVQGEKTMLDVFIPVKESLINSQKANDDILTALQKAVDVAHENVEYTKNIIATKGRASYLEERSLGHQDPGATSSSIMLESLYKYLKENKE